MLKRLLFAMLLWPLAMGPVFASDDFLVKAIRVKGLQRASRGAVVRQLPVKEGETFNVSQSEEVLQAVFKIGYFKRVDLFRDGGELIIEVQEKSTIGQLKITGIKSAKKVDEILRENDFAEGRFFDEDKLAKAKQALERHYLMQGKYGVKIQSKVIDAERNRVLVTLDIFEGDVAKIKGIRFVGNNAFTEKQLLEDFRTQKTSPLSFLTKSDRYAREKLEADLESLRDFYMNRGYVKFQIDSTQVTLTPDKKNIYITIRVSEGSKYQFGKIDIPEVRAIPNEKLDKIRNYLGPDETYSKQTVLDLKEAIETVLGNEGYYFADVRPSLKLHEDTLTIDVHFDIERKEKALVRRIHLKGNKTTKDEVLRRELPQMEGAPISTSHVKGGKSRIEQKGFAKNVNVEVQKVEDKPDVVDLTYDFQEQKLGQIEAGLGYSTTERFHFNFAVRQQNFFGTGKHVNFNFDKSRAVTNYLIGYYEPYFTIDEIGLGADVYYNDTDLTKVSSVSEFATDRLGTDLSLGMRIGVYDYLSFGLGVSRTNIRIPHGAVSKEVRGFIDKNGDTFAEFIGSVTWRHNTLNKYLFPTKGLEHVVGGRSVLPGAKVPYYELFHHIRYYYPLTRKEDFVLKFKTQFNYGDGYGKNNSDGLPFFKHYYAGGAETVRGYEERSLGPLDSAGKAFGGNVLVAFTTALIFPNPIKPDLESIRTALFFDAGQVYDTRRRVRNPNGLRYSVGLSVAWHVPMLGAPILFNFSRALNPKDTDKIEGFSFSFATSF